MPLKCAHCEKSLNMDFSKTFTEEVYKNVQTFFIPLENKSGNAQCFCHKCWKPQILNLPFIKLLQTELDVKQKELSVLKTQTSANEANSLAYQEQIKSSEQAIQQKDSKIKSLTSQVHSLQEDLKVKQTQIDSLQQKDKQLANLALENTNLNKYIEALKQEKTNLNSQYNYVNAKLNALTSQIDQLKNEGTSLKNTEKKAESQNAQLEKEKKDIINKNEILKRENAQLTDNNTTIKDQIEILTQKNALLVKQNEEMKQKCTDAVKRYKEEKKIDDNKYTLQYREKEASEEDYDCRIVADSFYSLLLNNSWPIEYRNRDEYLQRTKENTSKIAVVGYEKTGKSFVLSRLTGRELPQGKMTKTVGICLLYPLEKELPWTALDTPGTNISVKSELMKQKMADYFNLKGLQEEEKMRMLLGDNILMENLLQQFVVKESQVLLVVIGRLRRDDQRLIKRIKMLPGKRIIVVHNLLETSNIDDVEKIIQEDIIETFSVRERTIYLDKTETNKAAEMHQKVYLETDEKVDKAVEHVIMAHEGSAAGSYYNEAAITYIKNTISSTPYSKSFDLAEVFSKHLNEHMKSYLSSKGIQNNDAFTLIRDDNQIPQELVLDEPNNYDLKLSSADEFGQIKTFAREALDSVPYTTKIVTETSDDNEVRKTLRVEFEVVGKVNEKNIKHKVHEVAHSKIQIEIRGKSEDNTLREEKGDIRENTRRFGDFTILTEPLDLEEYVINRAERPQHLDDVPGLKIISFRLYPAADGFD